MPWLKNVMFIQTNQNLIWTHFIWNPLVWTPQSESWDTSNPPRFAACFDSTTAAELMKCSLRQSNEAVWFEIDGKLLVKASQALVSTEHIWDEARLDGSWQIEIWQGKSAARTKVGWVRGAGARTGRRGLRLDLAVSTSSVQCWSSQHSTLHPPVIGSQTRKKVSQRLILNMFHNI